MEKEKKQCRFLVADWYHVGKTANQKRAFRVERKALFLASEAEELRPRKKPFPTLNTIQCYNNYIIIIFFNKLGQNKCREIGRENSPKMEQPVGPKKQKPTATVKPVVKAGFENGKQERCFRNKSDHKVKL